MKEDWVHKIASLVEKNHVNFYRVLSDYDMDNDGYIAPDDLKMAFIKLQINLTNKDMENMLRYFDIANIDRISIKEFSKNFFAANLI